MQLQPELKLHVTGPCPHVVELTLEQVFVTLRLLTDELARPGRNPAIAVARPRPPIFRAVPREIRTWSPAPGSSSTSFIPFPLSEGWTEGLGADGNACPGRCPRQFGAGVRRVASSRDGALRQGAIGLAARPRAEGAQARRAPVLGVGEQHRGGNDLRR